MENEYTWIFHKYLANYLFEIRKDAYWLGHNSLDLDDQKFFHDKNMKDKIIEESRETIIDK